MSSLPRNAIEISRANVGDAVLLARIGRETFLKAFEGRIAHADLMAFAEKRYGVGQQEAELAQPGTAFFIVHVDGEVAGYAKIGDDVPPPGITASNVIELERLYLYPRWYGRGASQTLMDACLAEAYARSCGAMWLDVWDQNDRAEAFYRKYGFGIVGERSYIVGNIAQRHLLMLREFR